MAERLCEPHLPQAEHGTRELQGLLKGEQVLGEKYVGAPAEEYPEVRDVLLAQVIKGRIGHLREMLVEIVEKRAGFGREDVRPGRVPHRTDGFLPFGGHRVHNLFELLLRQGEKCLPEFAYRLTPVRRGHASHRDRSRVEPGVPVLPRETRIAEVDTAVREIDLHAGSGVENPLSPNARLIDRKGSGFGAEIKRLIGKGPPGRAEPVPVQPGADVPAVGVHDDCGAIPRLHRAAPEFVVLALSVRRGHHDGEQVLDLRYAAPVHQGLDHLVEAPGIADPGMCDELVLREPERFFPGERARAVPCDRVDLAVMGDQAEGLRLVP